MYEDTTVIIPTLNEGRSLASVLALLVKRYRGISVIISDDGSDDGTREVAAPFGRQRVLFLDRRGGKEKGLTASVLDGIRRAKTKYVVVMDGDGQHPAEKVKEIVGALRAGNDFVVACRDSAPGWQIHRQVISLGAQILGKARLAAGGNLNSSRDLLSGFFGARREVCVKLMKRGKFQLGGYKVLFELLKGARGRLKIGEVGYVFGSRGGGGSKMRLWHFILFLKSVFS